MATAREEKNKEAVKKGIVAAATAAGSVAVIVAGAPVAGAVGRGRFARRRVSAVELRDHPVGEVDVRGRPDDAALVEDRGVSLGGADLPHHTLEVHQDLLGELGLTLRQLLLILEVDLLEVDHLLLVVGHALLERGRGDEPLLLLDVRLLALQALLHRVELLLVRLEHGLQGVLRVAALLGLEDGALHVDHREANLRVELRRRHREHQRHQRRHPAAAGTFLREGQT